MAKANYTSGNYTKFFTLPEDPSGGTTHNYYRVLPAYGKAGDPTSSSYGKFVQFYAQHFGYRGVNPNGGEPYHRTFGCIFEKNRKTGMVTSECAECTNREEHIAKKENLEAQLKSEGKSDEEIKSDLAVQELAKWLKAHNRDSKFYLAVMNQKREFGILKVPYEAQDMMRKCIKETLEKTGLDATDVEQGFWLDFQRSGKGFTNTSYAVVVLMEQIPGEKGKVPHFEMKMEPLSLEEQTRAEKELPSLEDIPKMISAEQIQRLVDCSGDPEEVDAILGIVSKANDKKGGAAKSATPPASSALPAPTQQQKPAPAAQSAAKASAPKVTPAVKSPSAAPAPVQPAGETQEAREAREFQEWKAAKAKASPPSAVAAPEQAAEAPATPEPPAGDAPAAEEADFLKDYGFQDDATAAKPEAA
jgi:hypothetical protein